ncbi:hypothetical protein [Gemmatimonas sp.]
MPKPVHLERLGAYLVAGILLVLAIRQAVRDHRARTREASTFRRRAGWRGALQRLGGDVR